MARYFALFLVLLVAVSAQDAEKAEETFDATVVKAEGTPEMPIVEFDKLPEDVKKIVEQKLTEQAVKEQPTITLPAEQEMSDELKQDIITLMNMKNANMIPFDLLTPESKDEVLKALQAQEAEKKAKETVVNYDEMSTEEKEYVKALFRDSGIARPIVQRPYSAPVSFRMSPYAAGPQSYGYNPYSLFFRRPYHSDYYRPYGYYPYAPAGQYYPY